jgi:Cof subfamily protein (haloacid dehalogenase superfamily)
VTIYKLAAIDLDGTLLDANAQISEANLKAIGKLKEHKIIIVLASGRNELSMVKFHRQLDLSGPIISHHGALVKNPQTDEIIFASPLTKTAVTKIVREADKYGATVLIYHKSGIFTTQNNELTASFNRRASRPLNFIDTFELLQDQSPYKIIWMHEPEVLSQIHSSLDESFKDNVYVVRNQPEYLEFLSPNANKAIGLQAVAKYLNVDREAIISFGDADNDVPMLSWAAWGIAMHHGTEGAKKAANIIAAPGSPETSFARAVDSLFS